MKVRTPEPEGFTDFQRFWLIWREKCRKTDGRGKALPAWDQMMQAGYDPSDIIDGATWYLRNLSERDAPYIPLAASWMRSLRFLDDCELERAYQQRLQERPQNVVAIRSNYKPKFLQDWEGRE